MSDATPIPRPSYPEARAVLGVVVLLGAALTALPSAQAAQSGWLTGFIATSDDVGEHPSIAVDSQDNPHIAYHDNQDESLGYAVRQGGSWSTETVAKSGDVGEHTSIAVDSQDNPHVSYYDYDHENIEYAVKKSGSWSNETVASTGDVGDSNSIAVDSQDRVHLAFYDRTDGDLEYALKSGGSWSTTTVASGGNVGDYTTIAVDSQDNPHIGYYDSNSQELKYAVKQGGLWSTETVTSSVNGGLDTSIAVDSQDRPQLSYVTTNQKLGFALKSSGSWSTETVPPAGSNVDSPALAVTSDNDQRIAYQNDDTSNLDLAIWSPLGWTNETVAGSSSTSEPGFSNSIALDSQDNPHIAHYDVSDYNLGFAEKTTLPEVSFSHNPSSPTTEDTVDFTDTSSDPDGSIQSRSWDFGDGTTDHGPNPSHQYGSAGTYTVKLTVTDDSGVTNSTQTSIQITKPRNNPPAASFTASTTSPSPGQSVQFTDGSSDADGSIQSRSWDFGDGATSSNQNPTHTYSAAGNYTVKLTVTDDDGATDTATQTLTVRSQATNTPPNASFTASPSSPTAGETVQFTDTSTDPDGTIQAWSWDLGDGNTSTAQNPSHTYASAGDTTVCLNTTDDNGSTARSCRTLSVQSASTSPNEEGSNNTQTPPPEKLVAEPTEDGVTVEWSAPEGATDSTEYAVYRGTSPDEMEKVATVPEPSYTDAETEPGTTYYYEVAPVSQDGQEGQASTASITTPTSDGGVPWLWILFGVVAVAGVGVYVRTGREDRSSGYKDAPGPGATGPAGAGDQPSESSDSGVDEGSDTGPEDPSSSDDAAPDDGDESHEGPDWADRLAGEET